MLEKEIRDFDLKTIGVVTPDDKDGKMSDAFKPIAETILSGYFKVTKNNSDSYVTSILPALRYIIMRKVREMIRLRTL